jgi:hypothetical protein
MATITIQMNSDGSYRLVPPFIVITPNDQGITWNLSGANWDWVLPQGITCDTNPPNPPYAAWPSTASGPTRNTSTNQFTANANSPNTGSDWIFYKWNFSVQNTSTSQQVNADPDIGNQPQP